MPDLSVICRAIGARRLLRITYSGKSRLVEPWCHGTNTKGKDVLRAFQLTSSDGSNDEWRMFDTASIAALEELTDTFEATRPDYNAQDKHMREIHCCI